MTFGEFRSLPFCVRIVLKKEFAEAALADMKDPALAPLNKVLQARGLEMESTEAQDKKLIQEVAEYKDEKPEDGPVVRQLKALLYSGVMSGVNKRQKEAHQSFDIGVPSDSLEGFLDDLNTDQVRPMIEKVYKGESRVL